MAQMEYCLQFVTLQIFVISALTLVHSATVAESVYPFAEVYLATESENLTLLSKDPNSEILILPEFIRSNNTKQFQNVVLVCNAAYPIEWMYSGDGAPTRVYSSEIRTIADFRNESSYEYFSTLVVMQERNNEHLTGTYTCRGIHYPFAQVYYHLYFPGSYGFPTIRNRVIRPPKNDTRINLPCMTTDPRSRMMLFKIESNEVTVNLTGGNATRYDPKIGFTLDMSKMENPYGTYYCNPEGFVSFWKIDVVPRYEDDVIAEPQGNVINQENFSNQTFMCASKTRVAFSFPNSYKFGSIEYSYNQSRLGFPYSAVFTLNSDIPMFSSAKYMKINCLAEESRRVLKSWEYTAIGTEEITVKYDRDQRRVMCCSKSGLSPTHQFVKCETRTDCRIKEKCFQNGRCEYPFPPQYVDAPLGCSAVEFLDRVPTHVLRCSVGDRSRTVAISENIEQNDILMYNGTIPGTEEILKISAMSLDNSSLVKFKCSGSLFYFSTSFVFGLERTDGSMDFPTNATVDQAESHEPVLTTKMGSDIRRVYCFAPLTRSSEWRNVSMMILVSEPSVTNTRTAVRGRSRLTTLRRSISRS